MHSRSIDTFNIIQQKNLKSSLNRLITKKSKKLCILKKRNGY